MAFDFPASPAVNDIFAPVGGPTYRWNGTVWKVASAASILEEVAGMVAHFAMTTAPAGWLKANGAAVNLAVYTRLAPIYCGDANNATASWGFKCTNPANPTGSRSTAGTYIVVPDGRGEFLRGWADGGSVDSGRALWAYQGQMLQDHTHTILSPYNGGILADTVGGSGSFYYATNPVPSSGVAGASTGAETRPLNLAGLACIKY